jgi:hypothetical protein
VTSAVEQGERTKITWRTLVVPSVVLLALSLLLYGWPVPRLSEELYLPLVKHVGDASYLRGDWTFSGTFPEHWVFDHLFAPLTHVLSLSAFGWLGRLVSWTLLAGLLVAIGARLRLTVWTATAAIALWLVANQSFIGTEWIIGTFESKTVAYVFLLGALLAIASSRIPIALALLGIAFSFHPAVGLWNALAVGVALLVIPATRATTLRWCWLGILLAIPGIIGGFAASGAMSTALRRFVVLQAIPYHTDPFFGAVRLPWLQNLVHLALLLAMFAANLWWWRRHQGDAFETFVAVFQIVAAVPFALAYVARLAHIWSYLQLMPLRSFPLFVPLFFAMHAMRWIVERWDTDRARALLAVGVVCSVALVLSAPLLAAPRMVLANVKAWTGTDHFASAFDWLHNNTPSTTTCIVPPDRQDYFERAARPTVANWQAIRYDAVAEWRSRIDALLGTDTHFDGPGWHGELTGLRASYDRLTAAQVTKLASKYGASCIVTSTAYPFPVIHRTGDVTIYGLTPQTSP